MPSGFMGAIAFDARPVPVSELLVWRGGEDETSPGHLHLWSWLLYHYLWNKQGKALTEYTEAPLSSAQVHLIHLAARMAWPQPEREADELRRAELDEALLEDPGDAGALGWRLTAAGKQDVERLRKALSARPGDWRGWTALGKWLPSGKEKEEAYRKAAALNPENAVTQNNLAWELVTSARAKEALPFANRALDLAPWDAAIMDTLAHVAAGFGKCPEALRLQRRAIATMEWQGRSADVFKKGLVEMEARCAVPLAAPASAR
jgi:tetratricopeptide (TPR) repeat protein